MNEVVVIKKFIFKKGRKCWIDCRQEHSAMTDLWKIRGLETTKNCCWFCPKSSNQESIKNKTPLLKEEEENIE